MFGSDPTSAGTLLAAGVTSAAVSLWLLLPRGTQSPASMRLGTVLGLIEQETVCHAAKAARD